MLFLCSHVYDQVTEYHFRYYYVNEFTWKYTVVITIEFLLLLHPQQAEVLAGKM